MGNEYHYHNGLGIDSNMIEKERDLNVLRQWQITVEEDVKSLALQMKKYEMGNEFRDNLGEDKEKDWWYRVNIKHDVYEILLTKIKGQIMLVRQENAGEFFEEFYNVCHNELYEDEFNDLVAKTNSIVHGTTDFDVNRF